MSRAQFKELIVQSKIKGIIDKISDASVIEKDILRTFFPAHFTKSGDQMSRFQEDQIKYLRTMTKNVLYAASEYSEMTGYLQGVNSIAASLCYHYLGSMISMRERQNGDSELIFMKLEYDEYELFCMFINLTVDSGYASTVYNLTTFKESTDKLSLELLENNPEFQEYGVRKSEMASLLTSIIIPNIVTFFMRGSSQINSKRLLFLLSSMQFMVAAKQLTRIFFDGLKSDMLECEDWMEALHCLRSADLDLYLTKTGFWKKINCNVF